MKTRTMGRSGLELTELAFGAAGIGNLFRPMLNADCEVAVQKAWENGIRYFDSAPHYGVGLSERRLGLALHNFPEEQRILSTKVGRILEPLSKEENSQDFGYVEESRFRRVYDYSYDAIMRSFEDSLQRLGASSIDILYMHDIGRMTHGENHEKIFRIAMDSGFKAMDELRSQGLVKSIGLGVNEWQVCDETLAHADFDSFMVANCFTLLNNDITDTFTDKCVKKDISLIAAAPFNSGILAKGSAGASGSHYIYDEAPKEVIDQVIALEKVCQQFDVSLQAAAIQFPLLFDCVKTVVIGMTQENRIRQNVEWYNEVIPAEFWLALVEQNLLTRI